MKIIECPRDAMQGIVGFIPTQKKAAYINELLHVGFDTIDFGSFVSPKAIPQMRDTSEVLAQLDLNGTDTQLLAIVANKKGAHSACQYEEIAYLGYPLSLSETFQQRNTNRSIEDAMNDLEEIQDLVQKHQKILVVYLSMGFGNPYGDPYEMSYVGAYVQRLDRMGIQVISLADTIGVSSPESIATLFGSLIPQFPQLSFGAHLHTTPETTIEKVEAAYMAGCRRIDGAIYGFGGCPMAKDDLTGNMATEKMLEWFQKNDVITQVNMKKLKKVMNTASAIFHQ